jgi:hypothetical protein
MYLLASPLFKRIFISTLFCSFFLHGNAQILSIEQLVKYTNLPHAKFESALEKKYFLATNKLQQADTLYTNFKYAKLSSKKNAIVDSTIRLLKKAACKDTVCITYQTSSYAEFCGLRAEMKAAGFYCNQEADSLILPKLLYQYNDYTIHLNAIVQDSVQLYGIQIQQQLFPNPQDMFYGDDLLVFTSHEYLVYFFGAENVKKDIYFLSGNEVSKCSILFSNTPRQVVFLWKDEVNRCGIESLLFGGQQKTKSAIENGGFVGQSNWVLKSGIHPGMPLFELRKLNNNNFKFYGGNAANTGSIIDEKNGHVNFKKEELTLGCVNCNDDAYSRTTILTADDALAAGRIVFVLSVCLYPTD